MARSDDPVTMQVISRDDEFIKHLLGLAASFEREGGLACRVNRVEHLEGTAGNFPDLALIDLDSMADAVLERIPRFRQQGGRTSIAVAYQHPSPERLLKAMRAGANDYLSTRPTMEDFSGLLSRALEITGRMGTRPRGQLVTVFSNKGGVGTTMVTINVAAAVAAQVPGAVAVVDLVFQRGDMSVFLDVPTNYTVTNLVTELDRVDPSYLRSVLPRHPAGMYVVPAPMTAEEGELVTPVQVSRLLQRLCATFDAVVVDAGNEVNDCTLAALDASDRLLLVTLPSLPSVRNMKRSLELFERLRYDPAKLIVVVNRYNAKEKLHQAEMEEALGRQVQWSIPNDYLTVVRAINQGTGVRFIQPDGALAKNFEQLVTTHVLAQMNGIPVRPPARLGSRPIRAVRAFLEKVGHGTS